MPADSEKLAPATSGFVLAAAITVLVNTALACAKDAYLPLKNALKSLAGHDWTTQGLIDLLLFIGLGLFFARTGLGERIDPRRLITILIAAVTVAALGLALWFSFT